MESTLAPQKSNKRVPQKQTSKSAFGDVKKPTEYFCCRCGKSFGRQPSNFSTSKSGLYAGNNGYLPICKNCLNEIYAYYVSKLSDPAVACERVCAKFDFYFSPQTFESVTTSATPETLMTSYIGKLGISGDRNKSYDDYIDEQMRQAANLGLTDHEANIVEEGRVTWGLDLTAEDYEYLDAEFADWNARCNVDSKARESMVREICVLKLLQNKAIISGDVETYNKLSATMQKTLTTAELTPRQEQEKERASEIPLGVLIKKVEDEEPIPEPLPEFKDVDSIQKYIRVYFIGHLTKMLGLKNKYSDEYDAEMQSYMPELPDNIDNDDSEDIYDYLVRNGFSDVETDDNEDEDDSPLIAE